MARERYTPNYLLFLTPVNGGTTVTPSGEKIALNDAEKIIKAVPGATFADIVAKYSGAILTYGGEALGTGAKVSINGVEYTIRNTRYRHSRFSVIKKTFIINTIYRFN